MTKELHPNPSTSGEFNSRGTRRSTGLEDTSRGTSGEEDPKGRAAPGFVSMPFPIPGQWQGPGCSQPRSRMPEEPLSCSLPPQEQQCLGGFSREFCFLQGSLPKGSMVLLDVMRSRHVLCSQVCVPHSNARMFLPQDQQCQGVPVPGSAMPGCSCPRISNARVSLPQDQ